MRNAAPAAALALAIAAGGCGSDERAAVPAETPATAASKATRPGPSRPERRAEERREPAKIPSAVALRSAARFAAGRTGPVSVAVLNSEGELRGARMGRRYPAASVVKAMLLAAEVRRLKHEGVPLDSDTDSLLRAMITYSDNGAADSIYARLGDEPLERVAARAGMRRFEISGHWGNAQIAAADMASFFGDLDRQFPRRFREYAKALLGSVTESQSWGIPAAAGDAWAVRFKGGWLPEKALVHQAAELHERDGGAELAIVVLSDGAPSHTYGVETVRGVAERLLSPRSRSRSGGGRSG